MTAVTSSAPAASETSSAKPAGTTTVAEPVIKDTPPGEDEMIMYIDCDEDKIIPGSTNLTLYIEYNGADENAGYYTGAEYELDRLEEDGTWRNIPYADEMAWIAIAYEISAQSNAVIGIDLSEDMYTEPLTPGTYRIRKNIGGTDFFAEFEIAGDGTEHLDELGVLRLYINEITDTGFECSNIYPMPETYFVECDPAEYEDFCVGDQIEVIYSVYRYDPDKDSYMIVTPDDVLPSYVELDPEVCYKPVIYLYPEEETDAAVSLDYNGTLTITAPAYGDGWNVTAYPDGTIISGGRKYPYLFWEGERNFEFDTSHGFCVAGAQTQEFLTDRLTYLGLNEKEISGFLKFWLPYMENNPYNIITFAGTDYTDNARLDISPAPDTVIRVFMVFSPSERPVDIPAQQLPASPVRTGFTVVEWGGAVK